MQSHEFLPHATHATEHAQAGQRSKITKKFMKSRGRAVAPHPPFIKNKRHHGWGRSKGRLIHSPQVRNFSAKKFLGSSAVALESPSGSTWDVL